MSSPRQLRSVGAEDCGALAMERLRPPSGPEALQVSS